MSPRSSGIKIILLLHQDHFSRVIWVSPSEAWGTGAPSVFRVLHFQLRAQILCQGWTPTQNYFVIPSYTHGIAKINKTSNISFWLGCGVKRTLTHHCWNCKPAQSLMEISVTFPNQETGYQSTSRFSYTTHGLRYKQDSIHKTTEVRYRVMDPLIPFWIDTSTWYQIPPSARA